MERPVLEERLRIRERGAGDDATLAQLAPIHLHVQME